MKAIAAVVDRREPIFVNIQEPGQPGPGQILCRTVRVGIGDSDRELPATGRPAVPPGESYLILGHGCLAWVENIAPDVEGFMVGDWVVPFPPPTDTKAQLFSYLNGNALKARQPGIFQQHGYTAEYWIEDASHLQLIPDYLRDVAVLVEPFAIAEAALNEAQQIQDTRLELYQERAAVIEAKERIKLLCLGDGIVSFAAACCARLQNMEAYILGMETPRSPLVKLAAEFDIGYLNVNQRPWEKFQAPGEGFDMVMETADDMGAWREAIQVMEIRGVISLTARLTAQSRGSLDANVLLEQMKRRNLVLAGAVNTPRDFNHVAEVLRQLKLRYPAAWPKLITAEYSLADALLAWRIRGGRNLQTVINYARGS